MDDWRSCGRCGFLRETLLEMPCCAKQFCAECLHGRSRCPQCVSAFNPKQLISYTSMDPVASMISDTIKKCSHDGCNHMSTSIMLPFHESRCKFAAISLEKRHPELVGAMVDANYTQSAIEARRRKNILAGFLGFDNVQSVLAAAERGVDSEESSSTLECVSDRIELVKHLVLDHDTLPGIALKYGSNEEEIRRTNSLSPRDSIQSRASLIIPARRKPKTSSKDLDTLIETLKRKITAQFRQDNNLATNEEALFYLDEAEFDVNQATEAAKQDNEWNAQNTFPVNHAQESNSSTKDKRNRTCCAWLFSWSI